MPWRGPNEPGEWPTLGYDVGEWIEEHLVVPDGYLAGQPFKLTDEMWRFLLNFYRLYPHAEVWPAPDALQYTGAQLRRPQKWGKDPFGAAIIWAEALGPTRFDGWNADGEPVGAPYPTPLIVCLGTSEEQTANTYRPLKDMARRGPLINMSGLDVGDTRVKLPGGGQIDPVTTSARARLGAPLTFLTITESHLFTLQGGFRKVCGAVKRNVAGMDGRWLELTNAWDPSEGSEAQVTGEDTEDTRTYIDCRPTHRVHDLGDDEALYAELLSKYGDSAREKGGWVNIRGRIFHDARSKKHMEADRRRFFLDEIVVGQSVFVDPIRWDLLIDGPPLEPRDHIALGFDGSRTLDSTALIAVRLGDGRIFQLGVWEPTGEPGWRVPREEVSAAVRNAMTAYRVETMYADPYRWQDYLDTWSAEFPGKVIEFPTNVEQRMDKAIERFSTAFAEGLLSHDGSPTLALHAKNAVIIKGSRKKPRPGEEDLLSTHYLKMAKRNDGVWIDAAVAMVLAYHARGVAIEGGAIANLAPLPVTANVAATDTRAMFRPTQRLKL